MSIDRILYNGAIYTSEGKDKLAEALAITDGKIIAVGSSEDMLKLKDKDTEITNLEGKMVLPGFVESHAHPTWGGIELLYKVNLFDSKNIEEYQQRVKDFIIKNPELDFIQGVGWVNPHFDSNGPTKELLDVISKDIPIVLDSGDHHSVWANSKAIEMAKITGETKCPDGGVIEKDASTGMPSGTFRESAQELIKKIVPEYSITQYKNAIAEYQKIMASYGITMAHDAMLDLDGNAHKALLELDKENKHLFKMSASFTTFADNYDRDIAKYGSYTDSLNGKMFEANHAKFFIDGVVEGYTAYLKEPYTSRPDYYGETVWDKELLKKLAVELDKAGLNGHFHVIGDAALAEMLDVLEYVEQLNGPKERRPIAAHAQIVDPADLPRMKALGVIVSANPYWFVKEKGYYYNLEEPYLGAERASKEYPMKSFFDKGITVASASDFSVTPQPKPLRGIQMGVTRCFPEMDITDYSCVLGDEEKVSVEEMVKSFTINGAFAVNKEKITGSIEPNKLADLVILEKNIFNIPVNEIAFVNVVETISEGKTIFKN